MLSIRKINPMARAIGTMGAVAALVGAVTFAALPSNTVALKNNDLRAATANLQIGLTQNCSDEANQQTGMTFNNLVPGVESPQFTFCIDNTGNTPLNLTASIPTDLSASTLNPNNVTLHFLCGIGGAFTGAIDTSPTVGGLHTAPVSFGTLNDTTNNIYSCHVTAKLAGGTTPSSGDKITKFDIDWTGSAGS
jgi:hypothetical protein